MKRLFILAVAAIVATAALGQQIKVDREAIEKRIAKSDSDINDPKKSVKAATWVERGNAFYEAAVASSKGVYKGLDTKMAETMFGKPAKSKRTIGNTEYAELTFPTFVAYAANDQILIWSPSLVIEETALAKATEAYEKAYSIDAKQAAKVKTGLQNVTNTYKEVGENAFNLEDYPTAGDAFRAAYRVQLHPTINEIDTAAIFNAGFLYTVASEWEKGLEALTIARDLGYYNDGEVYYYMFHCYYGMEKYDEAKAILFDGVSKFPGNTRIVEGLIGIYSVAGGDPMEIIPYVKKAVEDDPENPDLWSGLGRIYDKLGESDEAVNAFEKAVSLAPNDFGTNFNVGLLMIKSADEKNKKFSLDPPLSDTEYEAGLQSIKESYMKSLRPLERAHELNPNDLTTIELLRNLTRRYRDEAGMEEKYNRYQQLFDQLSE